MRTKTIYTDEELAIAEAVENGEYVPLPKDELETLKKSLKTAASETIKQRSKRKAISIRLLEDDITKLKAMALNEGIPYQTYITHVIHKITTGQVRVS
jgi:predicted DNA binding CopG/RHH family protein